ncbi:hypothetical protein [Actinoplanes aureus]|nr:hypothetical protein [Actinoplanes aureus]
MIGAASFPKRLTAFLAALFSLIVAVTVLQIVENRYFQPESTVTAFFRALTGRDAEAAGELLTSVPGAVDQVLLQDSVLKANGYTPPDDPKVENAEITGNDATVRVSFQLGGQRHEQSLYLVRDSAATAGLFHRWRLAGGIYSLDVAAAGLDSVLVAGTPVALPLDEYPTVTLAAYPGAYTVSLPEHRLWAAQPAVAYVGGSADDGVSGTAVELLPAVKDSARTEIDEQIRAYLDECAGKRTLTPSGCPFSSYSYQEVRKVRWKITQYPQYDLSPAGGQLVVTTVNYGMAEVSGIVPSSFGAGGYPYSDQVTFPISGTVTESGGGLTYQPAAEAMD